MNKDLKNSVFIIDGSSFLYRAYYSIPPLTNKNGESVNALYGFCRMIKKIIDTYGPEYLLLVWDSAAKTFRHEMYESYKQTRQAAPSDLFPQKELIKEFADIIGIKQLDMEGVEADDLMYSKAKELQKEDVNSILVTSDKDLRQALDYKIFILDPFKNIILKKESVEEKLGFNLSKFPFYYSLVGDSSDNIPGVKGVGPKTAEKLVKQFDSLEDLYSNIEKVEQSERIKNLLKEHKDNAFLSRELFLLRFFKTSLTKECCKFDVDNWQKAFDVFEKNGFKSLLKSVKSEKKAGIVENSLNKKYKFKTINNLEDLKKLCSQIKEYKRCAIDTECTGCDTLSNEMIGISLCFEEGHAYYIPFGHKTSENQLDINKKLTETQLSKEVVLKELREILEDKSIEKYLHHAKFDALMLLKDGIELKGKIFDTLIAANLLVSNGQRIGLKYLSEHYFQEPMIHFSDILKENKCKDFSFVPINLATEYAAADAHQTFKLYLLFNKEIEKQGLQDLFYNLEMPLMNLLLKMELSGIKLDKNILKNIDSKVSIELSNLSNQIIKIIGEDYQDVNLNSPKQLQEILFDHLKLPVIKKTAGKSSYSTDSEVLKELKKHHPVPGLILKYRELFKLKSTYLDTLGNYVNQKTGRIHTSFSQTRATTGRLASSDPNLQNIPVDRFNVRAAFKAEDDKMFLSADYSQIELRVLGYLAQDKKLIESFKNNLDIHALTASGLFDVPIESVLNEQRQIGKRINFSILYGLTAYGLSKDLEISYSLAKEYIEKFMAQYPGVQSWMEKVVEQTKEKGYVETLFKRKRYLPGIHEKNKTMFDLAKRMAINTVVQGTAAELVKFGMLNLNSTLEKEKLDAKVLLQIHDELVLEVKKDQVPKVEQILVDTLQNVVDWNIPLIVTTSKGLNWQEITKS